MGEIKDKVLRDISLMPTFIEIDGGKYPAGTAVVDPRTGEVLKNVSKNFKLVTNLMLLGKLNGHESIRRKHYYITNAEDTTYISGVFPRLYTVNEHNEVMYMGFEIANSYALRFPPKIYLSFYNDTLDRYIKTDIEIANFDRSTFIEDKVEFNDDLFDNYKSMIHDIIDRSITPETEKRVLTSLSKAVPYRLKSSIWTVLNESKYKKETLYNLLMVVAEVCHEWGKTAYEPSYKFARKLFHSINTGGL